MNLNQAGGLEFGAGSTWVDPAVLRGKSLVLQSDCNLIFELITFKYSLKDVMLCPQRNMVSASGHARVAFMFP